MSRWPVVIVGAGPTGLTAAALLADLGVEVLLVERWDGIYPQPRAVHLDDEVYRILDRIGVADEFARISRAGRGLRLLDPRHRVLTEFSRSTTAGKHGYPAASMFDQPALEAVLRDAVARRDCVTLRSGAEVTTVLHERDGVRVSMTDRRTGAVDVVRAQFVLGADGANSIVRAQMGSRWEEMGFTQRWMVVDIETTATLDQWEGVHQVCDSHRAATFMRIGDTRYRWEFQLRDGEKSADFQTTESLEPQIRPWLGDIALDRLHLVRAADYTFRACVADRWRDRRVFLLGDAAHLTPPFIGQGLGSGVRDAANLAWKLAAVLRADLTPDILDSYEEERKPHAAALIRLAVTMGTVMTRGGAAGDRLRSVLAPRLGRIGGFVDLVTDSVTPALEPSYFVRPGEVGRRLPAALRGRIPGGAHLAGSLCPTVEAGRGSTRLDQLRTCGFLVITADEPTACQRAEIERRGATLMVVTDGSALGRWMIDSGARAAIVRPDRTVMMAAASVAGIYTHLPTMSVRQLL
ncbi:bifunctional 3-(3-hydroxy-phenyl)propionate/3-hydroxycinnamic acid hydroxylase [Gordonia sp. CPCC 205515]|uniref:bifunctional 3-(3-hydroxy-phenyl)propionate/3-hydroxycinnamic acid hydroxylase n=1 Tax=Gordonia sp. CPCC 205515 TaxID=3140791 RepID=UPI003AF34BA9